MEANFWEGPVSEGDLGYVNKKCLIWDETDRRNLRPADKPDTHRRTWCRLSKEPEGYTQPQKHCPGGWNRHPE